MCPCPRRLSLWCSAMLRWQGAAPEDASAAACLGDKHGHVSPAGNQAWERRNLCRTRVCECLCAAVPPGRHNPLPPCEQWGELAGHQHEEGTVLSPHWSNWCKELGAAAGTGAGESAQQQPCHLCPTVLNPPLPPILQPPGSAQHLLRSPCPSRATRNRKAGASEGTPLRAAVLVSPSPCPSRSPSARCRAQGRCPAAAPWQRHKPSCAWAFSRAEPAHVAGARL